MGPREVIGQLKSVVVVNVGRIGVVAEPAESQDADGRSTPRDGWRVRHADAKFFDRVFDVIEFAADVIEEMVNPEADFVDQRRLEDSRIVDQRLVSRGGGEVAIQIQGRVADVFVIPTEAPEPVRLGTFHKIDARGELVFVRDVVLERQVVAYQP